MNNITQHIKHYLLSTRLLCFFAAKDVEKAIVQRLSLPTSRQQESHTPS